MEELNDDMYKCEKCYFKMVLKSTDTVRCTKCGYRILSKLRTKKVVSYSAR